jgi:tRNA A-37 threonylcarbamoyl transferase component Bud32/tetratricopeptide (TPR) repeat protein
MPAPAVGATLSHYRILQKLGAGGMGEVYLAEDLRLRRQVALKFLPEELTRDADRRRRFAQEARAAAGIEHPHIAAVYDIDEVDGSTVIAMEYVRGQSLREAISIRKLEPLQALELAVQVADALAKAHERGIVHRDLKPENIMVSEDGYVKVIDFGLAKLLDPLSGTAPAVSVPADADTETQSRVYTSQGRILGTVAYMSPEQARGAEVDARSDIFSFGVVLYEMLSGKDPFRRPSAVETLSAILRDTPPPLNLPTAHTPPELQRVLRKALAKDLPERYQNMKELAGDLRMVRERLARPRAALPSWPWLAGGAALSLLLAVGVWWLARADRPAAAPPQPLSVLVADFQNATGDAVFDGALEQALGIGLEGASFITSYARPQARRQAAELDSAAGGKLDERLARLVCRSHGIKVAVAGSIEQANGGYLLRAWALDPVGGQRLTEAERRVGAKAEVLQAADVLAAELRRGLGERRPEGAQALAGETFSTGSLDAMNSYARAQELQYQGQYAEAMAEYRRAAAHDSHMGRAYSGLAALLANQGERQQAEEQYEQALARVDRMSEREKLRTRGGYYLFRRDSARAVEQYTALVRQFPADTAGHANLAFAYFYAGDMARAMEEGRRAVEIYPRNVPQRNNVALYALYAGDFATAEKEARAVLDLNAAFEKGSVALALAQIGQGRNDDARATYDKLRGVSARGASFAAIGLADLALYEGRPEQAVPELEAGIAGDTAQGNAGAAAHKSAVLAEALLQMGRTREALAAADRAAAGAREESVAVPVARVYLAAGREAAALKLATALGAHWQPAPRAYGKLIEAEALRRRKRAREALGLLQEAQKLSDTWLGRFHLGLTYLDLSAFPEAHADFDACWKRRGEAAAVFADDVPSFRYLPPVHYYLGRAQEALKSPQAAESYKQFLAIKAKGDDPLAADARTRLAR